MKKMIILVAVLTIALASWVKACVTTDWTMEAERNSWPWYEECEEF